MTTQTHRVEVNITDVDGANVDVFLDAINTMEWDIDDITIRTHPDTSAIASATIITNVTVDDGNDGKIALLMAYSDVATKIQPIINCAWSTIGSPAPKE